MRITFLAMVGLMFFGCASKTVTHEQLHSVLWMQTAIEYEGLSRQAYALAATMLDPALEDDSWSAATEQTHDFESLPPAIILDVDETVLDNSAYQARLILRNESYSTETWNAWCRETAAAAVPGAVSFTRMAAERGVEVFYVTNRRHVVESETRDNLSSLGFPLNASRDTLLTRGEQPDWGSDKTNRREQIAAEYRILLLIGDNLGDFLGEVDRSPDERKAMTEVYREYWGTRWIVLPNPQYGSWEQALLDEDSRARKDALRDKRDALKTRD